MYYNVTRYYNPEWGRFLNADDVSYLDPESIGGLNLYAYCGNNPIMRLDPLGTSWWNPTTWDWGQIGKGAGLILLGVGAVVVGIATLPFGGWIAVVAGVTVVAGIGTTAFGVAEVGEGITDYNIVRDTIFMGNQSAYDLTSDIFQWTAIVGSTVCGIYGITHTSVINTRSTPRTGKPHSAVFNKQSKVMTYYGKNGQMKYSTGFFERGHQWMHWHTELPHSKPINNVFKFIWEMIKRGF